MNYPYNRQGTFFFRWGVPTVSPAYQKYDGTAIVAYAYEHRGKIYKTYKTRMSPVLHSSRFGDFEGMWKEMLARYSQIPDYISMERTLIFELYGVRNKHLILYPIPLDTVLLFGINRQNQTIILPEEIQANGLPTPTIYYHIEPKHDFPDFYQRIRGEIEATNEITDIGIRGSEGAVIYIKNEEGDWVHYKCKPEAVMAIHCKPGLGKRDILTTCYNALENVPLEELDFEIVKALLLEEITEREIESRRDIILKCIQEVKEEVTIRQTLIDHYYKLGISIKDNKVQVMRHMSQFYPKHRMRYVYAILSALEGVM